MEPPKTLDEVRKEPLDLPTGSGGPPHGLWDRTIGAWLNSEEYIVNIIFRQPPSPCARVIRFEWCICNLSDDITVNEVRDLGVGRLPLADHLSPNNALLPLIRSQVFDLLSLHYVEGGKFRFKYSPEFLRWALTPPGLSPEWVLGIRAPPPAPYSSTSASTVPPAASSTTAPPFPLVAFISAVPATIRTDANKVPMVEINFLCIMKRYRSKRLAPIMIQVQDPSPPRGDETPKLYFVVSSRSLVNVNTPPRIIPHPLVFTFLLLF